MSKIDNKEMENIIGGASISGTVINALTSIIKTVFEIGKEVGSGIRRVYEGKMCPLE